MNLLVQVLVVVSCACTCMGQECLVNCTCSTHPLFGKEVSCRNISSIPKNLPMDLKTLDLSGNTIKNITPGVFERLPLLFSLKLERNQIEYFSPQAFNGFSGVAAIFLNQNKLTRIEKGFLRECGFLMSLDISSNKIEVIEPGAFNRLSWLIFLGISKNNIRVIQSGTFTGLVALEFINLYSNKITNITKESFQGLPMLKTLVMHRNKIQHLPPGVFSNSKHLTNLYLEDNKLTNISAESFKGITYIKLLRLFNNSLTHLEKNVFKYLPNLENLFLGENKIAKITADVFIGLPNLHRLHLDNNRLRKLDERAFRHIPQINTITLHANRLASIPKYLLTNLTKLKYLSLQKNQITDIPNLDMKPFLRQLFFANNKISSIPNMKFRSNTELVHIFLGSNQLNRIYNYSFYGTLKLKIIILAANPIQVIDEGAFLSLPNLTLVSLINTKITTPLIIWPLQTNISYAISQNMKSNTFDLSIKVETLEPRYLIQLLGYRCVSKASLDDQLLNPNIRQSVCYPCQRGSYKSFVNNLCKSCPPGGFYQDEVGYIGERIYGDLGCKQCPKGTYVKPELAPGKSQTDCRSCPQGTFFGAFAKFRSCRCMDKHYRLDRFGKCSTCTRGYACINESIDLAAGFYWVWEKTSQLNYEAFKKDLLISDGSHKKRVFKGVVSKAYACPIAGSCLGGMQSHCKRGYTGPLCAVCDKKYLKLMTKCQVCPTLPWLVAQIVLLVTIVVVIAFIILWEKKKDVNNPSRSLTDVLLARLKIVIGFYQVSSATFDSFSYISWPAPVLIVMKYGKMVQFNLLQIAPLNCIDDAMQTNAYTLFLSSIIITGFVIIFGVSFDYFTKCYAVAERPNSPSEERQIKVNQYKQKCYRFLFLILFITFPSTFTHIIQMLPATCHKICPHDDYNCKSYLKADYSIQCKTAKHDVYGALGTSAVAYCIGFPLVLFVILRNGKEKERRHGSSSLRNSLFLNGLRFLYENYSPTCWFWEIVELVRKIIFSSILMLMAAESRLSLGLTSIFSGLYSILFVLYKPIDDTFEHWLQLASLMASSVNFTIGMLIKIPEDETSSDVNKTDGIAITVLLMIANIAVVGIAAVKYLASILATLIRLKEEPRCNISCCLEVLQVTIEVQGEMTDICAETTITENPVFEDNVEDVKTIADNNAKEEEDLEGKGKRDNANIDVNDNGDHAESSDDTKQVKYRLGLQEKRR